MVLTIAISDQCSLFKFTFFTKNVCSRQVLIFTPSSITKIKKPFILMAHNFIVIEMMCLYIQLITMHTAPEQSGGKGWIL